jgi:hypothetical protein
MDVPPEDFMVERQIKPRTEPTDVCCASHHQSVVDTEQSQELPRCPSRREESGHRNHEVGNRSHNFTRDGGFTMEGEKTQRNHRRKYQSYEPIPINRQIR